MEDYKEKIRNLYNNVKNSELIDDVCVAKRLEDIFPELKEESEDERIRKCISDVIREYDWSHIFGVTKDDCFAWLEKRGDKNSRVILPAFTFDDVLALQCCMGTVKEVQMDKDLYEKLNDLHDRVHDAYHLEKQCEQKSYASETMNEKGDFDNGFTRMMEKEQKPAWNKEDEKILSDIVDCIKELPIFYESVNINGEDKIAGRFICDAVNWLKSLKDRVQPLPKQEWSEEDEIGLGNALRAIERARTIAKSENDMGNLWYAEQWLKSLIPKNHWKPSDEQMKALDSAIHCYAGISPTNNREVFALEIMKEQLKKLK